MKKKDLNKTFLKQINDIAHSKSLFTKLKKFNRQYSNFGEFINDFEVYLSDKIEPPPKNLSSQDQIFEAIILRLDTLSDYKNLAIKIYLETQKNPKYLPIINKYISNYFKGFLKSPFEFMTAYAVYIYAFNVWIEDSNSMDKTMAAIGNSFENLNKFKNFLSPK